MKYSREQMQTIIDLVGEQIDVCRKDASMLKFYTYVYSRLRWPNRTLHGPAQRRRAPLLLHTPLRRRSPEDRDAATKIIVKFRKG